VNLKEKCKSSKIDKNPQNVFTKIVKSIEVSEIFNIFLNNLKIVLSKVTISHLWHQEIPKEGS